MTTEEPESNPLDEILGPDIKPPGWREDADWWYLSATTECKLADAVTSHTADMRRRFRAQQKELLKANAKPKEINVATSPTQKIQEAVESYFQWMLYLALIPGGLVLFGLSKLGVSIGTTGGLIVMAIFVAAFTLLYLNRAYENAQAKKAKRRQARHRNRNNIN
jgi:hypothetical protein